MDFPHDSLSWQAKSNTAMAHVCGESFGRGRSNDHCKPLRGSKVTLLGMATRKIRMILASRLASSYSELLKERGAEVEYSDPHIPHTAENA